MHRVIWEGNTDHGHYQVVDGLYDGRHARVLYSGSRKAAQSGVARDGKAELLFDYNQRLFELAQTLAPQSLLIIGGGAGTLAAALLNALPDVTIDMVEPDPGLTKLGYDFFDLPVDERLRITHSDGRSFLQSRTNQYQMIVLDAFSHTTIPPSLQTAEAFQHYHTHLRPDGVFAMNVISGYYGPSAFVLKHVYAAARATFDVVELVLASGGYSLWLPQNFILVAHNDTTLRAKDYMRGITVDLPHVSAETLLHDTN